MTPPLLHVSIGADLIGFEVHPHDLSLKEVSRVTLPAPVQYVWPHPARGILYVGCSNRAKSNAEAVHTLSTVAVEANSGALRVLGEVALSGRPIHVTVDAAAEYVLAAYSAPSLVTSHRIGPDGIAGEATAQASQPTTGIFAHQIRVMPTGAAAIVVARGNDAYNGVPEEPGSLEILSLRRGVLANLQTVAPGSGYGFGPRHLDFHPGGGWAAVSIERQNELHIYSIAGDRLSSEPVFKLSTLQASPRTPHDQLAGAIHFHPSGKFLYVVNRNDASIYGDRAQPSEYEGNNIAAYAFDAQTGKPTLLQHVPTESIHVRTFSLDDSGTVLVSASILPAKARRGQIVETMPSRLSFFHVASDGRLTLARLEDMGNQHEMMFWSRLWGSMKASH